MYLGIDLGTSGVKAMLIDADQRSVGSAQSPLRVERPHPGWSEQSPQAWIQACEDALDRLHAEHPKALAATRGIGLSGQMHGATLIDASDQPLRPAMLWNDTRAHEQAAGLDADPDFRRITGNIVFPGFTAPKLLWLKTHESTLFERIEKVLLPKDYLRLWLTGECVSEMSDAAGTSWLDTAERRWSKRLLEKGAMRLEQMPRLVEGNAVSGQLRRSLSERWKIRESTVVAGGAGDNAASAIGSGTIASGSAFVSLGTSGVVFVANDRYLPNPESAVHAFCHALPGTWHQMGVILSAASALEWFATICSASPTTLINELGETLKRPSGVLFTPYLSGERTPHNDALVRARFVGLGAESDRRALTQAVLEGVAFALRDNLLALRAAGSDPEAFMAVGGGARSAYWLALIATVLDRPVQVPRDGDYGAAFGAARLGLMAAENAHPETVCSAPPIARTFMPNTDLASEFNTRYAQFRAQYPGHDQSFR